MTTRSTVRRSVQRAKGAMPEPVGKAARSAVVGFGWATAPLRMDPTLVLVGAQRCGTTTMFRVLADHPDVVRPPVSKGVGFFDERYTGHSVRWYRGHFPIRALAGRTPDGRHRITYDSSGYSSFHPLAAERIAATLPHAKTLLMVRDPVERAFSAYKHERARGFETETFERALELERERLSGEVDKMIADPSYASFHHRHHAYVARGEYAAQAQRLTDALGRDRVYVMDADRFFAQPADEFARFAEWLGLSAWRPTAVEQWNARPSSPMDPAIRARLAAHFEPHDEALVPFLGHSPSWRERPAA